MKFTRQDEAHLITVRIEGQLDAITTPDIRPAFDDIVAAAPKQVVLDLGALSLIDSSGVGAIVSLFKRIRAGGGDLRVVGTSGQPLAIFKLLRLDKVFSI